MDEKPKLLRIFCNTWFSRFVKREKIGNKALKKAIADIEKGLIDADLGGNIIKQRIARPGQSKSGGYRTIIVFRNGDKAFFVYGFSKNDRDNLTKEELASFKKAAKELLALSEEHLNALLEEGGLTEVE